MDSASLEVHHRPEVDCLLCAERILKPNSNYQNIINACIISATMSH